MAGSSPFAFQFKPLPPRLRNVVMSSGLCVGLIMAYYMAIGNETIPPDTRVVFSQSGCGGTCPEHRIDIAANGDALISQPGAPAVERHLTKTGLRQILHAFRHENFLDLDVAKFSVPAGDKVCDLGLTLDHRKTMIRYGCGHPPVQASRPLQVVANILQRTH